jgi:hypothetical protein
VSRLLPASNFSTAPKKTKKRRKKRKIEKPKKVLKIKITK